MALWTTHRYPNYANEKVTERQNVAVFQLKGSYNARQSLWPKLLIPEFGNQRQVDLRLAWST